MKKLLHYTLTCLLIALLSPAAHAQEPGTKVESNLNLYYGTTSSRTDAEGNPTWDYYGAPTGGGTNGWDSSPYEDFFYSTWEKMNFRMLFPDEYNEAPPEKYPMIVMLHGLGEGGGYGLLEGRYKNYPQDSDAYRNNDHQLNHGGEVHLKVVEGRDNKNREFPGFVLFPQTSRPKGEYGGEGWEADERSRVIKIVEELLQAYPIDPNRIYIHGLSNGGNGVWNVVEQRPDLFAAMLPMSAVPYLQDYRFEDVVQIPTWHFQGENDKAPSPARAHETIEALEEQGGTPRYTEYAGLGHAVWNRAYNEDDFFSWMLGYSKLSIHVANADSAFCEGEPVEVRLAISPGFDAYEWKKDDELIAGATEHYIEVTELGSYSVRFKRNKAYSNEWTEWSTPQVIGIQAPTPPARITASGSTTLPALDGATSVTLSVPEGYESYEWQNATSSTNAITVDAAGTYRVSVTEEDGCPSNYSPPVIVTVGGPTDLILAPENFSAEQVSGTRANLFWQDRSENETGFEIYRATQEEGPYEFITKTDANTVYFADKDLSPNTDYYYKLRAVNNIGSSPPVSTTTSTGVDTEAPAAPESLTASTNLDRESTTLSWEPATDNVSVEEYIVYQVNADNTSTEIGTTEDTSFIHTNLTAESTYTYYVRAKDGNGNMSAKSNQVTETLIFCGLQYTLYTGIPYNSVNDFADNQIKGEGKIENFLVEPASEYYASIDEPEVYYGFTYEGYIYIETPGIYTFWTTSDDGSRLYIKGEEIINNDGRHGNVTVSGNVDLSAGPHRLTVKYFQATGGQHLKVEYRGPDGSGISRQSIPSSVLCSAGGGVSTPEPPAAPTNLTATAISESQIDLSWVDNNADATGYEIYRSKDNQDAYQFVATVDENTAYFEDTALEASTTYFYKLRTVTAMGESLFTDDAGKLTYEYYEGTWDELPDFALLSPIKTGKSNNFDISPALQADYFAFVFSGKITIEEAGEYTFFTNSDDGSKLYINGAEIVDNDGLHGNVERSGSVTLSEGIHDIRVEYFEKNGGEVLGVRYRGPGISKGPVPDTVLNPNIVSATTTTDEEAPTAPENLVVKSVSATTVGLAWDRSTDNVKVVGYDVFNVPTAGDSVLIAQTDEHGDQILDEENENNDNQTSSFLANPFNNGIPFEASNEMALLNEATEPRVSASIEGLTEDTDYEFIVKARDAAGNLSLTSNAVTFTTNPEQPLPIELVDFYALADLGFVKLHWVTASEQNNDYFTIERSLDGKEFREIGKVDGAGDSNELLYYSFEDNNPVNGLIYYQLKQTDTNGVFKYSSIVSVAYNEDETNFEIALYPNPVTSPSFQVRLNTSNEESQVLVRITDMVGKIYLNKAFPAQDLVNTLTFPKDKLSTGFYIISIEQAGNKAYKKFIIE